MALNKYSEYIRLHYFCIYLLYWR